MGFRGRESQSSLEISVTVLLVDVEVGGVSSLVTLPSRKMHAH